MGCSSLSCRVRNICLEYLFFVTFRANFATQFGSNADEKKYQKIHESEGWAGLAKMVLTHGPKVNSLIGDELRMTKCHLLKLSPICRLDICKYIKEYKLKKEECSQIKGDAMSGSLPCLHHGLRDTPFCVAI